MILLLKVSPLIHLLCVFSSIITCISHTKEIDSLPKALLRFKVRQSYCAWYFSLWRTGKRVQRSALLVGAPSARPGLFLREHTRKRQKIQLEIHSERFDWALIKTTKPLQIAVVQCRRCTNTIREIAPSAVIIFNINIKLIWSAVTCVWCRLQNRTCLFKKSFLQLS